jgi:hypothetical protein
MFCSYHFSTTRYLIETQLDGQTDGIMVFIFIYYVLHGFFTPNLVEYFSNVAGYGVLSSFTSPCSNQLLGLSILLCSL